VQGKSSNGNDPKFHRSYFEAYETVISIADETIHSTPYSSVNLETNYARKCADFVSMFFELSP
jgi:hypothetical protein